MSQTPKTTTKKSTRPKKILVAFVCTGNTCRSPVAEKLFKHHIKQKGLNDKYRAISVGLAADDGQAMTSLSQSVLKQHKIPVGAHKSKRLTHKLANTIKYFICMTKEHKHYLQGLPNTYCISEITGGSDVIDPYSGTAEHYKKMYDCLAYAVAEVLDFLEKATN